MTSLFRLAKMKLFSKGRGGMGAGINGERSKNVVCFPRFTVNTKKLLLDGRVTDVLHRGLNSDQPEYVTFLVEGAEPLWGEIRLPNMHGWRVGERVSISIISVLQRPEENKSAA